MTRRSLHSTLRRPVFGKRINRWNDRSLTHLCSVRSVSSSATFKDSCLCSARRQLNWWMIGSELMFATMTSNGNSILSAIIDRFLSRNRFWIWESIFTLLWIRVWNQLRVNWLLFDSNFGSNNFYSNDFNSKRISMQSRANISRSQRSMAESETIAKEENETQRQRSESWSRFSSKTFSNPIRANDDSSDFTAHWWSPPMNAIYANVFRRRRAEEIAPFSPKPN